MDDVPTPDVILGDGIDGLLSLGEGSAGLVLTDLPSGRTRAKFDSKIDLVRFWPAAWHCLRPGGVVVVMASCLPFAAEVYGSQPAHYKRDLVWKKSLATGHLNSGRSPLVSHEFVMVLSRRSDHVYHPQMLETGRPVHRCRRTSSGENYNSDSRVTTSRAGATDRFPTTVLEFGSVGTRSRDRVHPQQKPVDLMRWLVLTYSDPGDLVVDPCAGSGSSGRAALSAGRRFLGWDACPRFGRTPSDVLP